jgi:protein-S-isoprenylcysteine O-methyltransferase Ste14
LNSVGSQSIAHGSAREKYYQRVLGRLFHCLVLAALFTKRTVYHESGARRVRYLIPILIGWYLLFRRSPLPAPLNLRIIPQTDAILVAAAALCFCGLAFCLWARAVLGRNWSGTVTVKENHELIVRGPYRLVRHPIYTGLLAMLIATAIQQGHITGMVGLTLVFVSLWIKLSAEEEVMAKHFSRSIRRLSRTR